MPIRLEIVALFHRAFHLATDMAQLQSSEQGNSFVELTPSSPCQMTHYPNTTILPIQPL